MERRRPQCAAPTEAVRPSTLPRCPASALGQQPQHQGHPPRPRLPPLSDHGVRWWPPPWGAALRWVRYPWAHRPQPCSPGLGVWIVGATAWPTVWRVGEGDPPRCRLPNTCRCRGLGKTRLLGSALHLVSTSEAQSRPDWEAEGLHLHSNGSGSRRRSWTERDAGCVVVLKAFQILLS